MQDDSPQPRMTTSGEYLVPETSPVENGKSPNREDNAGYLIPKDDGRRQLSLMREHPRGAREAVAAPVVDDKGGGVRPSIDGLALRLNRSRSDFDMDDDEITWDSNYYVECKFTSMATCSSSVGNELSNNSNNNNCAFYSWGVRPVAMNQSTSISGLFTTYGTDNYTLNYIFKRLAPDLIMQNALTADAIADSITKWDAAFQDDYKHYDEEKKSLMNILEQGNVPPEMKEVIADNLNYNSTMILRHHSSVSLSVALVVADRLFVVNLGDNIVFLCTERSDGGEMEVTMPVMRHSLLSRCFGGCDLKSLANSAYINECSVCTIENVRKHRGYLIMINAQTHMLLQTLTDDPARYLVNRINEHPPFGDVANRILTELQKKKKDLIGSDLALLVRFFYPSKQRKSNAIKSLMANFEDRPLSQNINVDVDEENANESESNKPDKEATGGLGYTLSVSNEIYESTVVAAVAVVANEEDQRATNMSDQPIKCIEFDIPAESDSSEENFQHGDDNEQFEEKKSQFADSYINFGDFEERLKQLSAADGAALRQFLPEFGEAAFKK